MYPAEAVADFRKEYRMDLEDLFDENPAKAGGMLSQIQGPTRIAIAQDPINAWTYELQLQTDMEWSLRQIAWIELCANMKMSKREQEAARPKKKLIPEAIEKRALEIIREKEAADAAASDKSHLLMTLDQAKEFFNRPRVKAKTADEKVEELLQTINNTTKEKEV